MSTEKRYCVCCEADRLVYTKKGVGWKDAGFALALTLVMMFMFFQTFAPEAFIIFPSLLIIMEIVIQLRFRLGIVCQYCGFDPGVYLKNPSEAVHRMQAHVEKLKLEPSAFMSDRALKVLKRSRAKSKASRPTFEIKV